MVIAVAIEGVLLALALLFIVALLRSHAEILRRLSLLEEGGWDSPEKRRPDLGTARGGPSHDISGETLHGDGVKISLDEGAPRTLLAFLSSTCSSCGPLWSEIDEGVELPTDIRLVVVTKGPERERIARLLELEPRNAEAEVVMSTDAWEDYDVPSTPHFVLVDPASGIAGRGAANNFAQLSGMLRDADDDDAIYEARSTSDRAQRAEHALSVAGISEGHPSLYPSQQDTNGSPSLPITPGDNR